MIEIPIEIGDVLLGGKFKNKKIVVKEITYDEYGLPLINGKSLLTMRIQKLMKNKNEGRVKLTDLLKEINKV